MNDRPPSEEQSKSIYLAGPFRSNDWRLIVVQGLHDQSWNWSKGEPFPVLEKAIFGRYNYVGPYWPYCKQQHEDQSIPSHVFDIKYRWRIRGRQLELDEFYDHCKKAIRQADIVFCVFPEDGIDSNNAGSDVSRHTLGELFYACAHQKTILTAGISPLCSEIGSEIITGRSGIESPRRALAALLGISSRADLNFDAGNGFVYFIENPANRHIKIGWAKKPVGRLKSFQTASSVKIRLLGKIPGSRDLERKLHADFQSYHVKGEWFFGVKCIRDFIKEETACSFACD